MAKGITDVCVYKKQVSAWFKSECTRFALKLLNCLFLGHFQLTFFGFYVYMTHNASYMCLQFFPGFGMLGYDTVTCKESWMFFPAFVKPICSCLVHIWWSVKVHGQILISCMFLMIFREKYGFLDQGLNNHPSNSLIVACYYHWNNISCYVPYP